jgi:hypothetical protein
MAGKWKHTSTSYQAWQPGKGGPRYIMLQIVGWTLFGTSTAFALCMILCQITTSMPGVEKYWPAVQLGCIISQSTSLFITGFLGVCSEVFIIVSLFVFEDGSDKADAGGAKKKDTFPIIEKQQSAFLQFFIKFQVSLLNYIFGPSHPFETTRKLKTKSVDQFKTCQQKWDACLERNKVHSHKLL